MFTARGRKREVLERERWFVLKIPRCDTNERGEIEVTVTSELHAQEFRAIEEEKD